jgi:hypothetical protein
MLVMVVLFADGVNETEVLFMVTLVAPKRFVPVKVVMVLGDGPVEGAMLVTVGAPTT